ncbi:hypothetical protein [Limnobacter parvus]|uniref:Transposase n=1 Tax=Limnobacter parvus TaxID=2939690 RepID=A0ABT1XE76_9BURK|nr:hypothetical protein [Limnobacter parvus]MCR2745194.1 hypothetical protein [Limnobacter parvus]
MNHEELQTVRDQLESVFAALYLIDPDNLNAEQRKQHQQTLAAAYLALVNAENADYDVLGIQARQQIAELSKGLQGIQKGVSGLATPDEKLGVVTEGLDLLARLARIVQI